MKAALATGMLAFLLVLVACGDDDSNDADDPRRAELGGVAELAVGAYASAGPEALADYMSQDALDQCPREQLQVALEDQPAPTGFKQLKDADFNGQSASATITISTAEGEKDINWEYVEEDGNWRIDDMPGLDTCE